MANVNKRLGDLLRSRRERAGLSQEELAERLARRPVDSVSRETISRLERGAVFLIKPDLVNALADCLPVTVAEICEAMGYRVGAPITAETGEMVAMYHQLPRMLQPVFVEGVRGLAQGLLRTVPQPSLSP